MSTVLVTQEMFEKMSFDTQTKVLNSSASNVGGDIKHCVLIVFANSDINAALYFLTKSLENPLSSDAIATVLVQESFKEDFIKKLQQRLRPYETDVQKHNVHYAKALETLKKLNAQVITVENNQDNASYPILVCDLTHEQLSANSPTGIVTLHTFRTAKEALDLIKKESLKFESASIWHENHAYAYELVTALKSEVFYINCYQVPITPLEENVSMCKNYVAMDKSYHYETLQHDGVQKSIVFPIGSIFAN